MVKNLHNSQKCINFALSNKEIKNIMDKQALLKYWAGELLAVKMELEKISFLLRQGVTPTPSIKNHLDKMLDRKKYLEQLIDEFEKNK